MSKDDKTDFSHEPFRSEPHVRTLVRVIGWALYSGYSRLFLRVLPYERRYNVGGIQLF
jgi:hypothetical protein